MEDLLRKAKHFGLGVWDFTKEKVEAVVDEMVKRGEVGQQEASQTVEKIIEKAQIEQDAVVAKVKELVDKAIMEMGLARQADLKSLEERLTALEKEIQGRQGPSS